MKRFTKALRHGLASTWLLIAVNIGILWMALNDGMKDTWANYVIAGSSFFICLVLFVHEIWYWYDRNEE